MERLPKTIIKKYGITKKAWKVYKSSKNQSIKKKSTKYTTKTTRSKKLAKRKRRSNKKSTGFKLPSGTSSILGAIGYGYIRERMSNALAETSIVKKLPISQFTDEGVMLGINYFAGKMGAKKIPLVGSLLRAQKQVELARVGQTLSDMQTSTQTGGSMFVN